MENVFKNMNDEFDEFFGYIESIMPKKEFNYPYNHYDIEYLIDCMPQNKPLYKDSGLWQIRSDDMQYVVLAQNVDESLKGFIIRYLEMLNKEETVIDAILNKSK